MDARRRDSAFAVIPLSTLLTADENSLYGARERLDRGVEPNAAAIQSRR
jgi:hypothetical protein